MTPDEARSLGRAIRAVRLERGLSQLKLAVAIGVKSPWISAWERGQSKPTAHGPAATPSAISKDQLAALATPRGREHQAAPPFRRSWLDCRSVLTSRPAS